METKIERLSPTRVKLAVEITPDEFKPSLDHAYEHIAEQVNVPGFRKGKIPAAILDQRVGRPAILAHAINDGLDSIYRKALEETKLRPLSQPQADVKQTPDENTFQGNLIVEIEVEVRPEIKLPDYKGLKVKVKEIKVSGKEVDEELDALRARFGTLKTVERAAKKGDFVSIDLSATIDGNAIDSADNISYEVGAGNLLDGIDEAIDTLTAGETTTFRSKLVGGEKAGEEAEVTVKVNAVKERELPAADDAFAQLASQFDTLEELKKDIEAQIAKAKSYSQGIEARDLLTEELLKMVQIPVSQELIASDVHRHLEGEGRLQDDAHRAEVTAESEKSFQIQMLLDAIGEAEGVRVGENELMQYLVMSSQNYGMNPNEFIETISKNGQVPAFVGEVARRKALSVVLAAAEVLDASGKAVDLAEFLQNDVAEEDHSGHDHD
ncbi:MAG: trigger factor [Actinomycetota bacterium]